LEIFLLEKRFNIFREDNPLGELVCSLLFRKKKSEYKVETGFNNIYFALASTVVNFTTFLQKDEFIHQSN
jgi:hypothetical protein